MKKEIIRTYSRLGVVIGMAAILTGAIYARVNPGTQKGDNTSNAQSVDLVALDVHVRDARRSGMVEAAAGGPAWVYLEVENLGAGTVPAGTRFGCRIYVPGKRPIVKGSRKIAKPIKGFAKQVVRIDLKGTGTPGVRKVRCTIDRDQKVSESNERNNVIEKKLNLKPFQSDAYRVAISNMKLGTWSGSSSFTPLTFDVENQGNSVPEHQFGKYRAMWQADCHFPGYPTEVVTEWNSSEQVHEYPFGDLPQPGSTERNQSETRFYDGTGPSGYDLPRELRLDCTVRVGVFVRKPTTQRHNGILKPIVAWTPVQVWWQGKSSFQVTNPDSKLGQQTEPTLDISVGSLTVSASQTAYEAPDFRRNTWVTFLLRANKGTSKVQVQCKVMEGNSVVKTVSAWKAISPTGPGSTTYEGKVAINMGQLPAGDYSVSCVADPEGLFKKDTARDNNQREVSFSVK